MTVRELIQTLIIESPNLDADVFISSQKNEIETEGYSIINISSYGANDGIFIEIEKKY